MADGRPSISMGATPNGTPGVIIGDVSLVLKSGATVRLPTASLLMLDKGVFCPSPKYG
jgi:hypothetical protein